MRARTSRAPCDESETVATMNERRESEGALDNKRLSSTETAATH